MNKFKMLAFLGLCGLTLAACGGEEAASNETESVKTEESTKKEKTVNTEEKSPENVFEYNEVIADNENFKATLLEIEHIYDETWDEEKIEVRFDVENKREDTIEVQARSLSINGRMVDESLQSMSQEVTPGKVAEAVLTLEDYDGNELPTLEGEFDMLLHVFSWDNMDYEEDAEVNVSLD